MVRRSLVLLVLPLVLAVMAGCGSNTATTSNTEGTAATSGASGTNETGADRIEVVASFYPLQWMAEQVGGDRVTVSNLAPPGAEPHDLELTPTDVGRVTDADLVVFLSGFQPAVDDAVAGASGKVFDAADTANLSLVYTPIEEHHEEGDEGADDEHEGEGSEATDPHFWLDPLRLADVADALAVTLGELDPSGAAEFTANAEALRAHLVALDEEYQSGLASCADETLVTSHNAFGYLADRYGFTQVGISGLSPEEEPSPADLAEVVEFVRDRNVRTIYFETLVSPAVAETVAAETGAATAVLDPIEGLSDESEGDDYLAVMRSNLANLESGQSCS